MDRYRPDDAAFDDKSSRSRDRSRDRSRIRSRSRDRSRDDRSSFRDGRHVSRDSRPYDRRDFDRRDYDRRDFDRRGFDRRDFDRRDFDRRDFDRRDFHRQDFDRRDYDRRDFDERDFHRQDFDRRDHHPHNDDRDPRARDELSRDTPDPSPSHPTALEDGEIAAPPLPPTATAYVNLDEDEEDEETRQQREEQERERRRQQRNAILAKFSTLTSVPTTVTATPTPTALTVPAVTSPAATAPTTAAPSSTTSAHAHSNGQQVAPTTTTTTPDDDDFDMFSTAPLPESMTARTTAAAAAAPQRVPHEGTGAGASSQLSSVGVSHAPVTTGAAGEMVDSWDDHEGYYKYRLGDVLGENGRFRVCGFQGSGVFSTVLRVKDQTNVGGGGSSDEEFVVKVIRNNETMYKAGMKEVEFLSLLRSNDPDGRRHCVRLVSNFVHRGHLCLVFEPMHMDLRKVMKKFGMVGLSMPAVRAYAQQLVIALRHMKKCGILHGDIKPDNILVNANMNVVKVCDFGSASKLSECEITPYLVSRFYRAPEVMLGLPYAEPVDLWSVGCVLYELFTGKILFNGGSNNEMLLKMMQVKGAFPVKMVKRAMFGAQHFDVDTHQFLHRKIDKASGCEYTQPLTFTAPTHDLYAMLKQHGGDGEDGDGEGGGEGGKRLRQLADFISQCLTLDPQRRPSVEELMKHPFIVNEQKEKAVATAAPVAVATTTSTARIVMATTTSMRGGRGGGFVGGGRR